MIPGKLSMLRIAGAALPHPPQCGSFPQVMKAHYLSACAYPALSPPDTFRHLLSLVQMPHSGRPAWPPGVINTSCQLLLLLVLHSLSADENDSASYYEK
jgi:hypothetical protein